MSTENTHPLTGLHPIGFSRVSLWYYGIANRMDSLFLKKVGRKIIRSVHLRGECTEQPTFFADPLDKAHFTIAQEVFVEEVYDLELPGFTPEKIIDCGAHIGLFSILAARRFPDASVVCFEPNPSNLQFLRRNVEQNHANVVIHECAVSTESGSAKFYSGTSCGGALIEKGSDLEPHAFEVKLLDLPAFLASEECTKLLLKMDIEGEELRVMPKIVGLLPQQTAFFFETHDGDEGWKTIEDLLTSNGFQVRLLRGRGKFCDAYAERS